MASDEITTTDEILRRQRQLQIDTEQKLQQVAFQKRDIQEKMARLQEELEALLKEEQSLCRVLGRDIPEEINNAPRQTRGSVRNACLAALKAAPADLTSMEVTQWIERQGLLKKTSAVPAVLSRLHQPDRQIDRDPATGRYMLS